MKRILVTLAVLVCALASAIVTGRDAGRWSPVVYPEQRLPLIFSHAKHLARGATCDACHPTAATSRSSIDNLIPTEAQCRTCHLIDRAVQTNCAGCHPGYTPGSVVARVYLTPSPLKFDHAAHAKQTCESCHAVRNVDLATTAQLPTMESCFACHPQGRQERYCTDCHLAKVGGLVETSFPQGTLVDHGPDFARDHRQEASRGDATCGACHERSECQDCHAGVVKPLDFHQANYLLVHAVEAKRGKPDCTACHRTSTFCIECHERSGLGTRGDTQLTSPGDFHPPGWTTMHAGAAKRNITSCASCHREEDCLTCHSAQPFNAVHISPHPPGWRGSARCKALDRGNRRMCLRCHITEDELGCDWSK
jgi:hypothetical protein